MGVIAAFIVIFMFVLLLVAVSQESGWLTKKEEFHDVVTELLASNEENIRETHRQFITLIEVLYKKNEKELEVELSNKGFNQLEYIFKKIREEDIKNSIDTVNDDKSQLEVELNIKHEDDKFTILISELKEQFNARKRLIDAIPIDFFNENKEFEEQINEQTDVLLNGDLSKFFYKLRNNQ